MDAVIAGREEHFTVQADGRCRCSLNGHCFGSNPQEVLKFIGGAKYQRLVARAENDKQIKRLEPFIINSKNFPDQMYCSLTCHVINKNLASIQKHMQGKKYRTAKEQYEKGKFHLIEEPDLLDEEDEGVMEESKEVEEALHDDDSDIELQDSVHMIATGGAYEKKGKCVEVEAQHPHTKATSTAAPMGQKRSRTKPRKKRLKAA